MLELKIHERIDKFKEKNSPANTATEIQTRVRERGAIKDVKVKVLLGYMPN